jgi:hypothetical protein
LVQQTAAELKKIEHAIHNNKTPATWPGAYSSEALQEEIRKDISAIKHCSYAALEKLRMAFAPTYTYHDLSINQAWSEDYLQMAERFDELYLNIINYEFLYPEEAGLRQKNPGGNAGK